MYVFASTNLSPILQDDVFKGLNLMRLKRGWLEFSLILLK